MRRATCVGDAKHSNAFVREKIKQNHDYMTVFVVRENISFAFPVKKHDVMRLDKYNMNGCHSFTIYTTNDVFAFVCRFLLYICFFVFWDENDIVIDAQYLFHQYNHHRLPVNFAASSRARHYHNKLKCSLIFAKMFRF